MSWLKKKKGRRRLSTVQKKTLRGHLQALNKLGVQVIEINDRLPLHDKVIVIKGQNSG